MQRKESVKKGMIFIAGVVVAMVLFQFLSLPSLEKQKKQEIQVRIDSAMFALEQQKKRIATKTTQHISHAQIAQKMPVAGVSVIVNFSLESYCNTQRDNISIANALNNTTNIFDKQKCLKNTKPGVHLMLSH